MCSVKTKNNPLIYIFFGLILHFVPFSYVRAESNDFVVTNITYEFNENNKYKRQGSIEYPELSSSNQAVASRINEAIQKSVNEYEFCNVENYHRANYEIFTDSPKYFSVKWTLTNKKNELLKISTLSFNTETGFLVQGEEIFNNLAKNFMLEIVKLSENHLATDTNWDQFVNKIGQHHIQFYIKKSKWHIVFNPRPGLNENIMDNEIPAYLIRN
ncbi:MAG: hypothetical protein ACRYE9_00450 [Janthinobacterium lividum]